MKVTKQVDILGTIQEEVDSMVEEAAGGQSDHEEHHDQDGVEFKMDSTSRWSQRGFKRMSL